MMAPTAGYSSYVEFFEAIKRAVQESGLRPENVQLVLPVDSALFLDLKLNTLRIAPTMAGQRSPFATRTRKVHALAVVGGPRDDGVTANTGTFFIGGVGVGIPDAWPITPGQVLNFSALDLAEAWYIAPNTDDRIRCLFLGG